MPAESLVQSAMRMPRLGSLVTHRSSPPPATSRTHTCARARAERCRRRSPVSRSARERAHARGRLVRARAHLEHVVVVGREVEKAPPVGAQRRRRALRVAQQRGEGHSARRAVRRAGGAGGARASALVTVPLQHQRRQRHGRHGDQGRHHVLARHGSVKHGLVVPTPCFRLRGERSAARGGTHGARGYVRRAQPQHAESRRIPPETRSTPDISAQSPRIRTDTAPPLSCTGVGRCGSGRCIRHL